MLVFFTKTKENVVLEEIVDALDIITEKYIIKIRISGINVAEIKQLADGKKDLIPIYDAILDLTQ